MRLQDWREGDGSLVLLVSLSLSYNLALSLASLMVAFVVLNWWPSSLQSSSSSSSSTTNLCLEEWDRVAGALLGLSSETKCLLLFSLLVSWLFSDDGKRVVEAGCDLGGPQCEAKMIRASSALAKHSRKSSSRL